jgi:hypothetical protein
LKGEKISTKTWENNIKQFLSHEGRIVRNLLNTNQTLTSDSYRTENKQDKNRKKHTDTYIRNPTSKYKLKLYFTRIYTAAVITEFTYHSNKAA